MPNEPKRLPAKLTACSPQPKRWTVEEFHFVGSHGLYEGRRAILIDGVILEQGQMTPAFACALEMAGAHLRPMFGPEWGLRQQSPLPRDASTDPVPNLFVYRRADRKPNEHPTTAALVVEVTDAHNFAMNTTKARIYAAAGVADYWVLDIENGELLVFRDPASDQYRLRLTLGPTDTVSPLAAPNSSVIVADLLP